MTKRPSQVTEAEESIQNKTRGNTPMNSQSLHGITPELLTTRQAAELCGVGERTLWSWSRSGVCPPPVKIGNGLRPAVRFRRSEMLAWIESKCPSCTERME
jgi:predicted DNA-binding transcriptional regulator AlpA